MTFNELYEFFKKAGVYYLATVDENNKPKVRPFGTVDIFEGKLYIQTGAKKECAKQMDANPYVEMCAFVDGKWVRLQGEVVKDDRVEAKKHMLDAYPNLRGMYNENDPNTLVYYFKSGKATLECFTAPKEVLEF